MPEQAIHTCLLHPPLYFDLGMRTVNGTGPSLVHMSSAAVCGKITCKG